MPFVMQRAVVAEYHPLVTDSNIPLFYVYINSFLPDVCNLSFYTSLFLHMVPYQKWGGGGQLGPKPARSPANSESVSDQLGPRHFYSHTLRPIQNSLTLTKSAFPYVRFGKAIPGFFEGFLDFLHEVGLFSVNTDILYINQSIGYMHYSFPIRDSMA